MTTIAYHHQDGQIAVDSRCTANGVIMSDDNNKIQTKEDLIFVLAGSVSDKASFVENYPNIDFDFDCGGFVIENNKVFSICIDEKRLWKSLLHYNDAYGSGFRFALSALDFGKSAKEAITYVMTRDIYTGGKVQVIDVKTGKVIS